MARGAWPTSCPCAAAPASPPSHQLAEYSPINTSNQTNKTIHLLMNVIDKPINAVADCGFWWWLKIQTLSRALRPRKEMYISYIYIYVYIHIFGSILLKCIHCRLRDWSGLSKSLMASRTLCSKVAWLTLRHAPFNMRLSDSSSQQAYSLGLPW